MNRLLPRAKSKRPDADDRLARAGPRSTFGASETGLFLGELLLNRRLAMANKKQNQKPKRRRRGGFPVDNAPLPESLKEVNLNAAGIDIGSTQHDVAVPEGRDDSNVRCFGTFTSDRQGLADWLEQCGIKTIARETDCPN